MEKETIADLCERLRKSGELDCLSIAHEWGPNCVNVSDCDACQKAVYDSIADRIEAAHQREMARRCGKSPDGIAPRYNMQTYDVLGNERSNAIGNLEKMDLDTGGAIKKLAVALGVEWNAANADKSVTLLKERIIHLLGGHLDERKEPTRETYTGLTVNMGKPAKTPDTESDTSDAEDTREKVEGSLVHLILGICAARLRTDKTNMELVARFKNEFIRILDRQEAITERNCRAEYEDMRDYLQAQVDRLEAKVDALESENDRLKVKVSNQRKELDIHQTMYDVEAVAQLKREKKRYKGMYNAEHQRACSQRRKIDRLTEENKAMRQALMDLRGILG